MMIALSQRQQEFGKLLLSEKAPKHSDLPLDRLSIYRNTILSNLKNALSITYPKVCTILGSTFFNDIASLFCIQHPPKQGCLDAWGVDFPSYLLKHKVHKKFPFLRDLAQFEWIKNQIFLKAELPCLGKEALADLMEKGWEDWFVTLNPTVFLLKTSYDFKQILDYADGSINSLSKTYIKKNLFTRGAPKGSHSNSLGRSPFLSLYHKP